MAICLRNAPEGYGLVAILLHWLVALLVIGLFSLGLWMVELNYYDPWYRSAPHIHKGTGVLLFVLVSCRLLWRFLNPTPVDEPDLGRVERLLAHASHLLLYLLLFAVMVSGYLIPTADGRPVDVFGLFEVPALLYGIPNQEDIAGQFHYLLALSLIGLASLHALAALKHHFHDHNRTLLKMLIPLHRPHPNPEIRKRRRP